MRIKDELNIFLVANQIKPASFISGDEYEIFSRLGNYKDKNLEIGDESKYGTLIGRNTECLDNLVKANSSNELCGALGYPNNCFDSFDNDWVKGKYMDDLFYAYKKDFIIPIWVPYVSFVPSFYDFKNGVFDSESERVGFEYRNFIIENNPFLIKILDNCFYEKLRNNSLSEYILEGNL